MMLFLRRFLVEKAWYFIELPKFRKIKPDMNNQLEQWLLFIDDYDRRLIKMAETKNKTLKEARKEMNYLTGDEEVRRLVELREKWNYDRKMDIRYAKKEGEKEGQKAEKIEIAKKMLEKNKTIEEIMEITDLTREEIEKLK